jgi:hypothetical protein
MILYQIYELSPAPWGTKYRFIVQYSNICDAEVLLHYLNKLDMLHSYYKIIEWKE